MKNKIVHSNFKRYDFINKYRIIQGYIFCMFAHKIINKYVPRSGVHWALFKYITTENIT